MPALAASPAAAVAAASVAALVAILVAVLYPSTRSPVLTDDIGVGAYRRPPLTHVPPHANDVTFQALNDAAIASLRGRGGRKPGGGGRARCASHAREGRGAAGESRRSVLCAADG